MTLWSRKSHWGANASDLRHYLGEGADPSNSCAVKLKSISLIPKLPRRVLTLIVLTIKTIMSMSEWAWRRR